MSLTQEPAIAALDIGTSKIKLGVYCPSVSEQIVILGSFDNSVIHGENGSAESNFEQVIHTVERLMFLLGDYCKKHHIDHLKIGLCSHVSSLLEWDLRENRPIDNSFQIWSDSSCRNAIPEMQALTGAGGSEKELGTFLPPGTNWLLTKLLHRKRLGFKPDSIFLQIGDAIFTLLSGRHVSHASSQVSICHQTTGLYAEDFLQKIGIRKTQLPLLDGFKAHPINETIALKFGLPAASDVYPSMGDYFASFIGLRLENNEAFMLGNTSEVQGMFSTADPGNMKGYVNIGFNGGHILYGSASTGSNIINWFFNNILKKKVTTPEILNDTARAWDISPADCPVFLPYIHGERAPFWNGHLTGSFLEISGKHTENHLFRSILESVAFARKQGFEAMGTIPAERIKFGGGASGNKKWNSIRASIMNKSLMVSQGKELALIGLIDQIIEESGARVNIRRPSMQFEEVKPVKEWVPMYERKYEKFLNYQSTILFDHE